VKSNLGHLEAAAGIAGFIKAVLAVSRAQLPATRGFVDPNPHIPFAELGLKVVDRMTAWPQTGRVRRAGVSSFGFGGTNAHVVLEQAPQSGPDSDAGAGAGADAGADSGSGADAGVGSGSGAVSTLVVSGKSAQRVSATAAVLAQWLRDGAPEGVGVADVAHTLNHHRSQYPVFATVAAVDREQAVAGLTAVAQGYAAPGVVGPHVGACRAGTVFVFSGQGSQWAGMGRRLLVDEPAFAAAVDELESEFVAAAGFSLRSVLESGQPVVGIERIQPVLVGVQLALARLWAAYGVYPDAVIGHSMGEVSAAVVAGALSAGQGLRVIAVRSALMARLSGQGAMALVELDGAAAEAVIDGFAGVTVAVHASPRQTVIAGPVEQVDEVIAVVEAQNRLARRVEVDVASHNPIVDPILAPLGEQLADLTPRRPQIPVISTTGVADPSFDADYWVANLRRPVLLQQAVRTAAAEHATFIEISPHPVLTYALSDTLTDTDTHHHTLATLTRHTHETLAFHTNLNATHTTRPPTTPHPPEPHTPLPTTPWHHTHHWTPLHPTPPTNGPQQMPATTVPGDWRYELAWPAEDLAAPSETAGVGTRDHWWVVGDSALCDELAATLVCPVTLAEPSVADTAADLTGVTRVVYAPAVAPDRFDIAAAYRCFAELRQLAIFLAAAPNPPALTVVTRDAQPVVDSGQANPAHAILWGLARTLAVEHPEIWGGIIDVDGALPPELLARAVREETATAGRDDQVAYHGGRRHVPRLRRRTDAAAPALRLPAQTSQLVIGATGSIGPAVIGQLAAMGATTIVAVSRNPGSRLEAIAERLPDTRLVTVAADAADPEAMAELFTRFGADLPPLDGIYLAALGGGPALLDQMTDGDVTAMFRPKLDAVAVLHKLSLKTPLRRFVLFSSVTGILGSRWLGHYTAAGAFLDAFAQARHALGLPATVIDWGLWRTDGHDEPETTDVGLRPMDRDVAISALPSLLAPDSAIRAVVVDADWEQLAARYRARTALPVLDALAPPTDTADTADTADTDPQWRAIEHRLRAAVAPARDGVLLGHHVAVDTAPPLHWWQASLDPDTTPYPGAHRVDGVDVVPVSVLIATLWQAGLSSGAVALRDVTFDYPIVVDRARTIRVVADGADSPGTVTVTSRCAEATADAGHWVSHAGAALSTSALSPAGDGAETDAPAALRPDDTSMAELQRTFGIDGQPFDWSIPALHRGPDRAHADLTAPGGTIPATLDAAIHVARLVDGADTRLLLPAAAEGVWLADSAPGEAVVEVRRRGGDHGADLLVDIAVRAPDGAVLADIRGLRYTAVDTAAVIEDTADTATAGRDWSSMAPPAIRAELETTLQTILAGELGMPATAINVEQPFPELGLDSMMAMTVLREAKKVVGVDLSATMLWNHPTISALAAHLTDRVAPPSDSDGPGRAARAHPDERRHPGPGGDTGDDSDSDTGDSDDTGPDGLLDELFASVESGGTR